MANTIQEMVAKFKEHVENNPKFREFTAEMKVKAETEKAVKEKAQAEARVKFAELFSKSKVIFEDESE